jgi:lysine 2,3-aminomutase
MKPDKTLRSADELIASGLVNSAEKTALDSVASRYAIAITPIMASLIKHDAGADPIGLQFLPSSRELILAPDENSDPIADKKHEVSPGLIHRYPDRVLIKVISACPVYCRFCFRKETVGPNADAAMDADQIARALRYIVRHREISEVIFTGGDPFMLSGSRIAKLTEQLSAIDNVKILRWHTRVPVVDPARIDDAFVRALRAPGKAVYAGLHINHAREMTLEAKAACARIVDAGIPMLSQTVLLKGVNDSVEALESLLRILIENRIKPYYLHQMDKAPGTAHFRVGIAEGQNLMRQLRDRMTGLAIPAYVADGPDGRKAHIDPCEA